MIIILVVLAAIALWALVTYNGIIGDHNRAQRAWSDVLAYERQKTKVLDALEAQASSFKQYEADVLTGITNLRSAIGRLPGEPDGQKLGAVQEGTKSLVAGLNAVFEAYPQLGSAGVVNNLMREIAKQEEDVGAAVTIFNRAVQDFNNRIQQFPGSLINSNLNKKTAINPFVDSQASASFEYKPNL
ncbi:LemA family protein [Salmonella enterica subsp. enterica]|nr:LemA family protein [Salmonella enterica subsp. enterica serovar Enteritidis]